MDAYTKLLEILELKEIQSEVTSKFEALPGTPSKVKYIKNLLEDYKLVPKVEVRYLKNEFVSTLHRSAAQVLYQEKKYAEALVECNKAICYADDAATLGICYASRTDAYLELEMYEQCLDNVRLAREAGCSEQMLSKLAERETECNDAISKRSADEVKKYQPELSYPASKKNACVADSIELVFNKKYGRYFRAKQDLKVGDIVILDKPYQVYLDSEYKYRKCANCLSENHLNLIACPSCTKTMFCSRSCLEGADKYHKILCPMAERIAERPSSHMLFALRILLSLMQDFGSVKALAAARDSRTGQTRLPKFGGSKKARQRNALDAFHDMEHDMEPLSLKDAVSVALAYSWLMAYTNLPVELPDLKSKDLFLDLLYRYSKICQANSHAADIVERTNSGMIANVSYGSNILPLISLLNHSCAPNTIEISCNESMVAAMIERPVKKGEQLFICYDAHHMLMPKIGRQQKLLDEHNFTCDCVACLKDYPTILTMRKKRPPHKLTVRSDEYYQLRDQNKALQKFEDCKRYLEKFDSGYPSMALFMVRMGLLCAFYTMCHNYMLNVNPKKEK